MTARVEAADEEEPSRSITFISHTRKKSCTSEKLLRLKLWH